MNATKGYTKLPPLAHSPTPNTLTAPFDRLDAGNVTELRNVDVLLDLPEVVSVARYHFRSGIGYEVIVAESADEHDYQQVIELLGHHHMIRCESWGHSFNGERRKRSLYWDHTAKPSRIPHHRMPA